MNLFTIIISSSLLLSSFTLQADETSAPSVLERYRAVLPFHEGIKDPMPVEKCTPRPKKKNTCTIAIEWEERPQKFYDLLELTEKNFKTTDPDFLATDLGRHYEQLKNFMDIYRRLNSCEQAAPFLSEDILRGILEGFIQDASYSATARPPCLPEAFPESPLPFQVKNIEPALENLSQNEEGPKSSESLLQDQILETALEKSIEANISFAMKFQNRDPLEPNFQKALVDEICVYKIQKWTGSSKASCPKEDRHSLESLVKRQSQKLAERSSSFMGQESIVKDINGKIDKINDALRRYNKKSQDIKKAFDDKYKSHRGQTPRTPQKRMQFELLKLKGEIFDIYRTIFSESHESGAGELFQMEAVKSKIKISRLEKLKP
ncbi:MAG: hypothetical protein OXB88_04730, partial [Bacteriovoracales bacterium]|nr:hypothetical protein [Bacteriovoracales bacterium]